MDHKKIKFATKAIHAGVSPDPSTGAIMTPIYQTSTYVQESLGEHKGFVYSRAANPTRQALEQAVAQLENAEFGACFGSGMAAIDCVLKMLNPGDEVITTQDLYGGTYRIFTTIFAKYGIRFRFLKMKELVNLKQLISSQTKLIWIETPTNPLMNIIDIPYVAKVAREAKVLLAVDNTFATPYLQTPIDLGAHLVMHSVTKYLGGHSDVVMGALVTSDADLAHEIYRIQNSSGAIPAPMDCFLVLRGLKTLHLRMERHCSNGNLVAQWLKAHDRVDRVYWPGFSDHPNHEVAQRQMRGFGGMISFSLKGNSLSETREVLSKFQVFSLAESLGGVESLVCHPVTMTHGSIPKEERDEMGIVDSLIRLSVGVEDIEDLVDDLNQALA
jgi:cystathionine beta-lyase/cystathionine gamma-synthase